MLKFLVIPMIMWVASNSLALAVVLYCSDEENIGFVTRENYEEAKFVLERFTLDVDFNNSNILGEISSLGDARECRFSDFSNTLYCNDVNGGGFSINKNTLKFHRTSFFLHSEPSDTIFIGHGSCQKF